MKHNFKELNIWKDAVQNAILTYGICKNFPKEELFGLTSQMKRASVSIPSNIAEGCGRGTDAQLIHFLDISLGSSCELETQIIIAEDIKIIDPKESEKWLFNLSSLQKGIRTFRDKLANTG